MSALLDSFTFDLFSFFNFDWFSDFIGFLCLGTIPFFLIRFFKV